MRFGLLTDFRNPLPENRSPTDLYADIIEHIVWAGGVQAIVR